MLHYDDDGRPRRRAGGVLLAFVVLSGLPLHIRLNYACELTGAAIKLLSQLSFPVCAGRFPDAGRFPGSTTAELRHGELGDTEEFL